ncbi:MAG: hypothetical protein HN790_05330 [Methylococcales bacterium]|mgnify:CR=1 FL=1|jgi:hypothetical protein|nr:hypothetical protein [Methylococcales bacterium]
MIARCSKSKRIAQSQLTNNSFIIHLGSISIQPKRCIDSRAINCHGLSFIRDTWVIPGGLDINLAGIVGLSAKYSLTMRCEEVSA